MEEWPELCVTHLGWAEPSSLHMVGGMWVNGQLGHSRLKETLLMVLTVRVLPEPWDKEEQVASGQRGFYSGCPPGGEGMPSGRA